MRDTPWTVADYATYAVLLRPDGTPAGRIHVIAEAHEIARRMNAATPAATQAFCLTGAEFSAAIAAAEARGAKSAWGCSEESAAQIRDAARDARDG